MSLRLIFLRLVDLRRGPFDFAGVWLRPSTKSNIERGGTSRNGLNLYSDARTGVPGIPLGCLYYWCDSY